MFNKGPLNAAWMCGPCHFTNSLMSNILKQLNKIKKPSVIYLNFFQVQKHLLVVLLICRTGLPGQLGGVSRGTGIVRRMWAGALRGIKVFA